ncbi:hypothetical protein BDW22DRAFT_1362007 [Trametopsis cervina]|nr:hypothetical protein BDW22DRAFT_1362007 [Trametopsis cervina]
MAAQSGFEFDLQKMQASSQYLCEAIEWLAANPRNYDSVHHELDVPKLSSMVDCLKPAVSKMQRLQNRYSLINRLPPEVLIQIFHLLMNPFLPAALSHSDRRTTLARIIRQRAWITRVCHYWRETALHTMKLWGLVWVHNPWGTWGNSYNELCFRRSGNAPLNVHVTVKKYNSPLLRDVMSQMHRVQDLHFLHLRDDPFASAGANVDTSQLKSLVFSCRGHQLPPEWSELFASKSDVWQSSSIRTLAFNRYTDWKQCRITNLRHLIIANQAFDAPSASCLLVVLSNNPRLEDLILSKVWVRSGDRLDLDAVIASHQVVAMPHLKRLAVDSKNSSRWLTHDISARWHMMSEFLEAMIVQPDGCLVHHRPNMTSTPAIPKFRSTLAIRRLEITYRSWTGTDGQSAFRIADRSLMRNINEHPQRFLRPTNSAQNVQELWVDDFKFADRAIADWTTVLQDMCNVTKLVLRPHFLRELSTLQWWLGTIARYGLFPSLSELEVHKHTASHALDILALIEKRRANGTRMSTLRFVRWLNSENEEGAFEYMKSYSERFKTSVVHVLFEDVSEEPFMPLPELCTTPSPVHDHWEPWR